MSGLRRIRYTYQFAVPAADGSISSEEDGDLSDLLQVADPYLFSGGAAPSLDILNDFFAAGGRDHGVCGAEWAPFTIDAQEFAALLTYLDSAEGRAKFHLGDRLLHVAATPAHVRTVSDFHDWKIEEALKDPNHYLNNSDRRMLVNGLFVTFPEYWASRKRRATAAE